jgi:transposase
MQKRQRFTAEFKREAVRLLKAGDRPAAVIAGELGIPRSRLYKWTKDLDTKGAGAFSGSGRRKASQDALAQLQRENALCLPQSRSGNSDDEGYRESAEQLAGRDAGPADGMANPCSRTDAFAVRNNAGIGRKDPAQVGLAKDDEVIEALPADRADQPLRMSVLP